MSHRTRNAIIVLGALALLLPLGSAHAAFNFTNYSTGTYANPEQFTTNGSGVTGNASFYEHWRGGYWYNPMQHTGGWPGGSEFFNDTPTNCNAGAAQLGYSESQTWYCIIGTRGDVEGVGGDPSSAISYVTTYMYFSSAPPTERAAKSTGYPRYTLGSAISPYPCGIGDSRYGQCVYTVYRHNPAAAPDLISTTITPTTAVAGSATTFTATVRNQGTSSTGPSTFQNQIQWDDDTSLTDWEIAGSVAGTSITTINAGGTKTTTGSVAFPSTGTWYIRNCADPLPIWNGVIAESDEGNNCGAWTAVTVAPATAPDLTPISASPSSAIVNVATTITAVIQNQGNAGTGATVFQNVIQYDDDNSLTDFETYGQLDSQTHSNVGVGGTRNITASVTFPSAGTWYIRGCTDLPPIWTGVIAESNENNNCGAWVPITVSAFPPIVASCSGTPASVQTGQNVTWTVSRSGGSGTYTYSWSGTESLTGTTQSVQKAYGTAGTKTASVQVTSGGQTVTPACTVTAGGCSGTCITVTNPPPVPTADLTATPSSILSGQSSTLSWTSTNATSCTGTGFSTGNAASGSTPVSPGATSIYQVSCTGAGGSANDQATVTVAVPTADISVSPDRVNVGSQTTVTWTSTNAASCTVSGAGLSSTATSGSQAVTVSGQQRYDINCAGATDYAIVNVVPNVIEF